MTRRPVAIVTGAASGIGRAIARRLNETHTVVAVDVDADGLTTLRAELRDSARTVTLDVRDRGGGDALVDEVAGQLGTPSALVNAAGILIRSTFLEETVGDWETTLAVNLDAAFWFARAFALAAQRSGTSGAIVNISSIDALFPLANHVAYSSSKGALLGLTKAMAVDLAPHGIRVNAIAPGIIATPMNAQSRADPARSRYLLERIPFKRFGRPNEVAEASAFLVSRRASYITGALLLVDGGWTASQRASSCPRRADDHSAVRPNDKRSSRAAISASPTRSDSSSKPTIRSGS